MRFRLPSPALASESLIRRPEQSPDRAHAAVTGQITTVTGSAMDGYADVVDRVGVRHGHRHEDGHQPFLRQLVH